VPIKLWSRSLRAAATNPFYTLTFKFAVAKLRRDASRCKSAEDYAALVFNIFKTFPLNRWKIRPMQVKEEITELLKILLKHEPRFLLELGTAMGGTFFLLTRAAVPDATLISVDLPRGPFGGGYLEQKMRYYETFALPRQKIHLLRMDSHEEGTLRVIRRILDGNCLDFLFIDGDHTYEGVRKDFEMYGKLVRRGGIIALHDICPHSPEIDCEVNRFWDGIKQVYQHSEIVKNCKQGWAGIGVVYV
jgi:predicted O-methyltransferase YrrM